MFRWSRISFPTIEVRRKVLTSLTYYGLVIKLQSLSFNFFFSKIMIVKYSSVELQDKMSLRTIEVREKLLSCAIY